MKYIEDTHDFDEDALHAVVPLMLVKIILVKKVTNMLWKGVTSIILIHPFQCMLRFKTLNPNDQC